MDLERRVGSVKEGKVQSAAGGKEKVIVIRKSENPRCFKGIERQAFWCNTLAKEKLG